MWYVSRADGTQLGPISQQELLHRIHEGLLHAADRIWCDGMPGWMAIGEVHPFAGAAQMAMARAHGTHSDLLVRMLVPVDRSALAIAAGYAGLFAVLLFPAPIALLLACLALRDLLRHPQKHGMGRAVFGLVMGAIFTLVLLVLLLRGEIP